MEELILKEFERLNSKAGDILMMKNLYLGLMQKLNPREKMQFEPAVNNLMNNGYIIYEDASAGPECLRLTDLGFEKLYQNSKNKEGIEGLILKEFEKYNSKVGDVLLMKNLYLGLVQKLNPKEKMQFESAVNGLIDKGCIIYEDSSAGPECIRLTNLGFEKLY